MRAAVVSSAVAALLLSLAVVGSGIASGPTGHAGVGPTGLIGRGKALYASLSCSACHTIDGRGGAGPTFKHLYGSRVRLSTGKTVVATDAYLLRSIQDPDAQIVAGRPAHVMTTVIAKGQVRRADALALVAFIKSLR
jgi:cytochrome c oxidase subunit 2